MKQIFLCLLAGTFLVSCNNQPAGETTAAAKDEGAAKITDAATTVTAPAEIADPKYMELGRQSLEYMSKGDMDSWANMYADNAVYSWSAGDSLAGKAAILKYWKNRRANVLDSISFTNDIWLPIKINQPQKGPDLPGLWLLGWYQVNAKYKNGQKLSFWVHTDMHLDANGKIDRAVSYIDRAPVNAALSKK